VKRIAEAWGWREEQIAPHAGGLINTTYVVQDGAGAPIAALQKLHSIWAPEVNLDIEAVTDHLAARGMETPRLVRTLDGRAWVTEDGEDGEGGAVWRALTWIAGESVHAVPDPAWAEAAGALVGNFHRAVADLSYEYKFARAGVHDTAAHLAKLRAYGSDELAGEILDAAATLPALPGVPRRHVHGDLKISNVIFRRDPMRAVALVDLDTFAKGTLAFELGDAMRSWCNPRGEDEAHARLELPIFAAAMKGFRSVADDIVSADERIAIVIGLETVCLELAARFCVDAFEDRYFGWDAAKFPSRRAHNLVRARGQLALGRSVRAARAELLAIVTA
jgi:Ser/Thr protein kinase RdoA (MazF antagonist)